MCKVSVLIGTKGDGTVDITAKNNLQARNDLNQTTTQQLEGLEIQNGKGNRKTGIPNYITNNLVLKNGEVPTIIVVNTKSN